jgi:hypothetical protein
MFFHTIPAMRPVVVKSDDKKRARLNCIRHFLASLDYPNKGPARCPRGRPADRRSPKHMLTEDEDKSLRFDV